MDLPIEKSPVKVSCQVLSDTSVEVQIQGVSLLPLKSPHLLKTSCVSSKPFRLNSAKFKLYCAREVIDDSVVLILVQSLPRKSSLKKGCVPSLARYPDVTTNVVQSSAIIRDDTVKLIINISLNSISTLFLRCYLGPIILLKVKVLDPSDYHFRSEFRRKLKPNPCQRINASAGF